MTPVPCCIGLLFYVAGKTQRRILFPRPDKIIRDVAWITEGRIIHDIIGIMSVMTGGAGDIATVKGIDDPFGSVRKVRSKTVSGVDTGGCSTGRHSVDIIVRRVDKLAGTGIHCILVEKPYGVNDGQVVYVAAG